MTTNKEYTVRDYVNAIIGLVKAADAAAFVLRQAADNHAHTAENRETYRAAAHDLVQAITDAAPVLEDDRKNELIILELLKAGLSVAEDDEELVLYTRNVVFLTGHIKDIESALQMSNGHV